MYVAATQIMPHALIRPKPAQFCVTRPLSPEYTEFVAEDVSIQFNFLTLAATQIVSHDQVLSVDHPKAHRKIFMSHCGMEGFEGQDNEGLVSEQ